MTAASDGDAAADGAYDALVFDLDRTLIEHDQSTAAVLDAACATLGIEPFCDPEAFDLAARAVGAQSAGLDAETFDRRVFETVVAAAGVDVDPAALAAAYDDALDNTAVSLRPGASEALAAADDYATALVTNGPEPTHATKLEAVGVRDRFDVTVFGSDVARVKPAPDPLELALDRLGAHPDRTLKIGDSVEKDVAAANEFGIDAAWIPVEDRRPTPSDPEPTYTLASLAELSSVLR